MVVFCVCACAQVWHSMGANTAFAMSAGMMVVALTALPHLVPHGAAARGAGPATTTALQGGKAPAPAPA